MNWFKEAFKRVSAETPVFFKRVRVTGNSLMAAATSVLTAHFAAGVAMPETLTKIAEHGLVVGFVMTTVASLACQNPEDVKTVDPNQVPKNP